MSKGLLGRSEAVLKLAGESLESVQEAARANIEAARKVAQAAGDIERIGELRREFERIAERARRPEWMTSTQLAAELSLHEETVRRWYREGRIRGHRISEDGYIRFDLREVEEDVKNA